MLASAPVFVSVGIATLSVIGWGLAFGTDVSTRLPHETPRYRRVSVWIDCVAWSAVVIGLVAVAIGLFVDPESSYFLHGALVGLLAGAWAALAHRPQLSPRRVFSFVDSSKCRACGYPTVGVRGGRCPECGRPYSSGSLYRDVSPRNLQTGITLVGIALCVLAAVVLVLCAVWKPPS